MRRLVWLLALPYVVVSSRTITTSGKYEFWTTYTHVSKSDNKFGFMECGNDKDLCDDLAAALNEAHERRTEKLLVHREKEPAFEEQYLHWKESKKAEWLNATPVPCKEGSKEKNCVGFDYKKACEGSCSEDK